MNDIVYIRLINEVKKLKALWVKAISEVAEAHDEEQADKEKTEKAA